MRALLLLTASTAAVALTIFVVMGTVRLVQALAPQLVPNPIVVSEQRIDFGSVPLNGSSTRELIVRNDSRQPVHARFEVGGLSWHVEPEELVLDPGVEWSVMVEARPARPGRIDDVLTIQVVGAAMKAVTIPLQGSADAPQPGRDWKMVRV